MMGKQWFLHVRFYWNIIKKSLNAKTKSDVPLRLANNKTEETSSKVLSFQYHHFLPSGDSIV